MKQNVTVCREYTPTHQIASRLHEMSYVQHRVHALVECHAFEVPLRTTLGLGQAGFDNTLNEETIARIAFDANWKIKQEEYCVESILH